MDNKLLIRRFLAFAIDYNIFCGIPLLFLFLSNPSALIYPTIGAFTSPIALTGFALGLGYALFKDCIFGGRSLGKLIFGLVVVNSESGKAAPIGSLILRNVTYFIFFIELICALANYGLRLGDQLAKTRVILKENRQ